MLRGILLSGKKFAGKDHVKDHITQVVVGRTVIPFAWATALRLEVIDLLSYMGIHVTMEELLDQKTKNRWVPLLQAWGTIRREQDPDYWVKRGLDLLRGRSAVTQLEGKDFPLFINTDTRYPNELAVREHGFIAIRLKVSREKQLERAKKLGITVRPEHLSHISETALDFIEGSDWPYGGSYDADYPWAQFDYIVDSDRELPEVYVEVDQILESRGVDLRSMQTALSR